MSSWVSALAFVAALGGVAEERVIDDVELVEMVRQAYRTCTGADWSAKVAAIRALMREADLRSVRVSSAVVREELLDGYLLTTLPENDYYLGICSTSSRLSQASKLRFEDLDPEGPDHRRQQIAARLGGGRVTRFEATKSYDGLPVRYFLYVPEGMDLSDLCGGQTISFRFILTGARHFNLENHFAQRFYGIVVQIVPDEACVLRCANGHEYAPSDGHRRCPRDGLPLE
jgi:hypothetical protein